MNILIPYSWLKEYLKVDLAPSEFASLISRHGPSIERWHHTDDGDAVFDVEVTTNRIDAYSVYGLAREAYAILTCNHLEATLQSPQAKPVVNNSGVNNPLYIDIDETLCPRFTAVVLDGLTIGKSPKFMVDHLKKVGERSLNNVVDVTNYVMWELGQPMHVFDYDKIGGHKMTLRPSRGGEKLITLDGTERTIPKGAIVIEDQDKLIDLAGIMGGKNSAVSLETSRVLLFVQVYNPHVIRKTTMQMAFRTEAASRFEKGLDPENVMPALNRASQLLREHAGAVVASDLIDLYPTRYEPKQVAVSFNKIQAQIAPEITALQATEILETLGFEVQETETGLIAIVPSFRADDIAIEEDLIEEIARLYGYHNIPAVIPKGEIPNRPASKVNSTIKAAKTALKHWGWTEVYTSSATSKENIEKLGLSVKACATIKNPLTEDFVYMRPHLLTTMLPVVAENAPRENALSIFELSKVYKLTKNNLPEELRLLELVSLGEDLLQLKGVIEQLLDTLGVAGYKFELDQSSEKYVPNTTAIVTHGGKEIGHIGELNPSVARAYGITTPLMTAKLFFDAIIKLASDMPHFVQIPKYPPLIEDLSFVVDQAQPAGPLLETMRHHQKLITDVTLIDTFLGGSVGNGKKSITLRVTYQSPTKLLSEKDITPVRASVIELLTKTYNTAIRS